MKRKLFMIVSACFFLYACSTTNKTPDVGEITPDATEENVSFEGMILKPDERSLLVISMDESVLQKFEPVFITVDKDSSHFLVGDMIKITFNGTIMESYPPQIGGASIELQKEVETDWAPTSSIPEDYRPEDAIEDGCFVIIHGETSNEERFQSFSGNTSVGIAGFLRKVEYTVEGDPIIIDILYDGSKYLVIEDISRDAFAGNGKMIIKREFKHLNSYEENDETVFYLSNVENMTKEEYEESLLGSRGNQETETFFIYSKLLL